MDYWVNYCKRVFDDVIGAPGTDKTNERFGGLDIEGDNIIFLNGSEDPW